MNIRTLHTRFVTDPSSVTTVELERLYVWASSTVASWHLPRNSGHPERAALLADAMERFEAYDTALYPQASSV